MFLKRLLQSTLAVSLAVACLIGPTSPAPAADWSKIRIGTEGAYAPFNYFDSAGQLRGLDIDIVQALCARIQATCEFITMQQEGLVLALQENRVDAVATGWSITEKRKKIMDFTDKYYTNYRRFFSCPGHVVADTSPEGLKGRPVGTQGGTASDDYLEAYYKSADLRLYKSMDEAYQDLGAGRLDAIFAGEATSYAFAQTAAGKGCTFAGERAINAKIFGSGVGIALRKTDTDLRDKLNAALKQILADGTYETITKKYFPFPIY
jgi:polar amino acid transport system substrate-binding protein